MRRPALGADSPALQQLSSGSVSAEVPAQLSALEQRVPATNEGLLDACVPARSARSMRPSCVLAFTTEMAREEAALRKALFVSVVGTRPEVQGVEVLEEVALSFGIDVAAMAIHQAMPEDFLLFLPDEDTVSRVYGGGRLFRGPRFNLHFKRWTRCAHASTATLPALVDVKIRGIPPHAWARSTVEHLLHGSCLISELHPATVEKSDLSSFMLRAWCFNPVLLHRDMDLLIVEPGPAASQQQRYAVCHTKSAWKPSRWTFWRLRGTLSLPHRWTATLPAATMASLQNPRRNFRGARFTFDWARSVRSVKGGEPRRLGQANRYCVLRVSGRWSCLRFNSVCWLVRRPGVEESRSAWGRLTGQQISWGHCRPRVLKGSRRR